MSSVVSTLVSLKLRLLRNGLRRRAGRAALYVLGSLAGILFAGSAAVGLGTLHGHPGAPDLAVLLVLGMTLGWAAMPLFLFASDESADPTRLTMLPLRPRPLLIGSLLAALIGPGPVLALLLLTGAAVAAASGPLSVLFAVLGVPLAALTLVTLSRAVAVGNARMLSSRKGKDLAVFGGLLFAVLMQTGNIGFQSVFRPGRAGVDLSVLHPYAAVLRWIPPVSAIDAARTAGSAPLLALLQLALCAGLLALLLRWWLRSLQHLMVSGDASTQIVTQGVKASRFAPEGRLGAVLQRHLRYAWREPRAKAAVFTGIGMTVVMCVLSFVQGWASVYVAVIAGVFLGLQTVNLFGMDGSAFWMVAATISTPADARAELRGRACAVVSYAAPVTCVLAVAMAAATGRWGSLAPALGLALGALGCGIALGTVLSVFAPYTMPADSNPMRNAAPGQGGLVLLNTFGSMIAVAVLMLPVGALLLTPAPDWLALVAGPLYGGGLALLALHVAGGRLAGRLPEVLAVAIER